MTPVINYIADPLWVSSRDHLAKFGNLLDATPWYKKLLGKVDIPEDFPQVAKGSNIFPLVYFSRGRLTLDNKEVNFQVREDDDFDIKNLPKLVKVKISPPTYRNLDKSLSFAAPLNEVAVLGRFQAKMGISSSYAINWVEIKVPSVKHSMLICIGNKGGGISKIQQETDNLFEEIRSRQNKR